MTKILDNILELMRQSLTEKDYVIGLKFFNNRKFTDLKDLVDSAIIRTENSLISQNPRKEYLNINMDDLELLQSEINYCIQTYHLDLNNDNYD